MSSPDLARHAGELTSLSDRLHLLLFVRLFLGSVVLLAAVVLPKLELSDLVLASAVIYLGSTLLAEGIHRLYVKWTKRRGLTLVNGMLMVDGVYIALVLAGSGPSRAVFMFLAYAHIVSITLLIGFRTGLKIALWQSILLITTFYAGLAGLLPLELLPQTVGDRRLNNSLEVAQAMALLLVAMVTAGFGGLNERELRRRKGELTIIADLSAAVEKTRRPSQILRALVEVTINSLNCNRAVAICSHGGKLVVVDHRGESPTVDSDTLYSFGGAVTKAAETSEPVLLKRLDATSDERLLALMPNALNVSLIPLVAEGEVLAVLVAEWGDQRRRRVTRPMIALLMNVAGRVALSLSNTFLLAEVQRLASVDGLTNLPNRRTFNQAIEREVARARRTGNPVSLVMLDIDHFKAVNDNHGHQMGDTVLAESAAGVLGACRGEDLPARYGGEEIAVIMPNCSAQQALAAADRIRVALSNANVALSGITASAGVATFPINADSPMSLIASADEALYESKENGRDCTTISRTVVGVPAAEIRA